MRREKLNMWSDNYRMLTLGHKKVSHPEAGDFFVIAFSD